MDQSKAFGQLRAIRSSELGMMLSWRNAPSVRANMYTRHEISMAEHLAWWERTRQRRDQQYFMYEREGYPRGIVGFTSIDPVSRNAAWAFYASPDAPKGTGSRMEYLALEHAFSELALHKLYCEVLAYNTPVLQLHSKFGFKVEGIFRDHHLVEQVFVDVHRLGMLAAEWQDLRTTVAARLAQR